MADSVHENILEKVVSEIESLGLEDMTPSNVLVTDVPVGEGAYYRGYPAICVSPVGNEQIVPTEGNNLQDAIGYPVLISIVDGANKKQESVSRDRRLLYREKIIDHFIENNGISWGVSGVDEVNVHIETGSIIDPAAWFDQNLNLSTIVLRCKTLKTRRAS